MTNSTTPAAGRSVARALALFVLPLILSFAAHAQIIDLRTREEISEQQLVERLAAQDVVLLGELHDNPSHHALRGQLIGRIAGARTTVVAEHLPASARVVLGERLLGDLEAAGFSPEGWGWPLHESLFDGIRSAGRPVAGGNLPKGFSKQLMMKGESALPPPLDESYRKSPLSAGATRQLDADLVSGHCGKLPERYLAPMRLVQRATDLSMANALLENRPSILVAGNGHVRKDYGVPQVIGALAPSLKISAVGFYERDRDTPALIQSLAGRYDYVWLTDGAERSDPCENFKLK